MRSNSLNRKRRTSVYVGLQGKRMPTRSYKHLVGAYVVVVEFSGVKDARKSVVRCRRSAEAHSPTLKSSAACKHWTDPGQNLDKHWTDTGQRLDNRPRNRPGRGE